MEIYKIKSYLEKTNLFNSLSSAEFQKICETTSIEENRKNTVIINEGDLADAFYVIAQGSVQVFSLDKDQKPVVLARLDKESYFGEQAYFNNLIRTASVRALTDVKLIKVNYDTLDQIFKKSESVRQYLAKTSLEKIISNLQSKVENIDSYVASVFAQAKETHIKNVKKDEIIFAKGDAFDYVYFISSGSVALSFDETHSDNFMVIERNHMFGELGILQNTPRSATAIAHEDSILICIGGEDFLKALKSNAKFESFLLSFRNVYALPKYNAIVNQYISKFGVLDAIFSRYKLSNGHNVVCLKVIDQAIFVMNRMGVDPDTILKFKRGDLLERIVLLKNNIIIGLTVTGEWDELNILCEMLLEEVTVHEVSQEKFANSGNILKISSNSTYHDKDLICNCMAVPYKAIKTAIDEGNNSIEQISQQTGASTACGACRLKILDILGKGAWSFATIEFRKQYSENIATFIIKPLHTHLFQFIAGQYILIKLQVDNFWIERAYTIMSAPNEKDHYEIMVKKHDAGALSPWLFSHAKNPLLIQISHPKGNFILEKEPKTILSFAGGIGITPFCSFIRDVKEKNINCKLNIMYSVSSQKEIAIPEDILNFLNNQSNIKIEYRETSIQGHFKQDDIQNEIQKIKPEYIYICGAEQYEDSIKNLLNELNFNADKIKTEKFVAAG